MYAFLFLHKEVNSLIFVYFLNGVANKFNLNVYFRLYYLIRNYEILLTLEEA